MVEPTSTCESEATEAVGSADGSGMTVTESIDAGASNIAPSILNDRFASPGSSPVKLTMAMPFLSISTDSGIVAIGASLSMRRFFPATASAGVMVTKNFDGTSR